jgi:outer membrane lipoprotein-sorting protein
MPFDPNKATKSADQYSKETDAAKVKILETVTYDGVSCKVVLMEEKKEQGQIKMWVREDYGIPLKVEVTEASIVKMVTDYKNMKVGPVPPEILELPKGVPVTDMSEMMKQLPAKQQ